jgi:hypothetical protein
MYLLDRRILGIAILFFLGIDPTRMIINEP